jgi:PAS domain S-box-containing protein
MLIPVFAPRLRLATLYLGILFIPTLTFLTEHALEWPPSLPVIFALYFASTPLRLKIQHSLFLEKTKDKIEKGEIQSRTQALIDALPSMILWLDDQCNYLFVNEACRATAGIPTQDLVGKPFGFTDPAQREKLMPKINEARSVFPKGIVFKSSEKTATGEIRSFQTTVKLHRSNNVNSIILVSTDITDLEKIEQALFEQREKAVISSRLVALGEMSAGVAHEIKNPLAIITGNTLILRHEYNSENPKQENVFKRLGIIENAAKRISVTIDSMRRLSSESESAKLNWIPIQEILDNITPMFTEKLRLAGISFEMDMQPNIQLRCQSIQIEQILLNLLTNAFDITKAQVGAKIVVHSRYSPGEALEIVVADNGPGVVDPNKLFTPFYTTKAPGAGTGLGLSLSKRFAIQNHAELTYDRQNGFTQFILTFTPEMARLSENT